MALFIGRIPREMKNRDLEDTFVKFGKITRLDVKNGFGFIEFEDKRDAEDAIKGVKGELIVEWAKNGGKRPGENECFHCGKEGHWARDCVDAPRGGGERGGRGGGRGGFNGRDRSPRRNGGRGGDRDRRDRGFDRRRDDRDRSPRRNDFRDRGYERRGSDRRENREERRDDRRERGGSERRDNREDRRDDRRRENDRVPERD